MHPTGFSRGSDWHSVFDLSAYHPVTAVALYRWRAVTLCVTSVGVVGEDVGGVDKSALLPLAPESAL